MTSTPNLRPTWRDSERFVPRAFVQPALRFINAEAASGVLMLVAAALALLIANSPWHEAYETFWDTHLDVQLGDVHLDLTLHGWVNDAAMALFFLLAGLEITRQIRLGELRNPRTAALPVMAAAGGMLVPALIYLAINVGQPGIDGWAIPVATDIAFALGVVTLLGRRVPLGAKVFLLTLAVADDIGGILIITVFYAEDVQLGWLVLAALSIAATVVINRLDVRSLIPYCLLGIMCWVAFFEAGIEAAIVGVIFGLLTPIRPFHDPAAFGPVARDLVDQIDGVFADGVVTDDEREHVQTNLVNLAQLARETASPLERIEFRLAPWITTLVVPLFAFANAGVRIDTSAIEGRVFLGIVLGLVVGKTVGVFVLTWLVVRLGFGRLPTGTSWQHVLGLGITAGIGFTVALYVTTLSFDDPGFTSSAKLGVLVASAIAGALGFLAFRLLTRPASVELDVETAVPVGHG